VFTWLLILGLAAQVAAQTGTRLSGRVTQGLTNLPMSGALVVIDELRREVRADQDGNYVFDAVPPGQYHVGVRAEGYTTKRTEVTVGTTPATLNLSIDFDLHFAEILSVSPQARPQFESYQPTSVLAGQDLALKLESTIGATLSESPGVAMRALGPGPARPVIRGLDGDRVVVLENGQRMGDLSSQSGDHGVPINPAAARRIEVVRGPATLLYGANALGGLVNVITDQIPTEPTTKPSGNFTFDAGSNGGQGGGAGDVHVGNGQFAFHFGGATRRSGDITTPEGALENSYSRMAMGQVGGAWTGKRSYIGASYGYDDTEYGIPPDHSEAEAEEESEEHEEHLISLTPKRHSFSARAGASELGGWLQSYRASLGVRRYEHSEMEGDEIGTTFNNDSLEGELLLSHRPSGRLVGSIGGWFLTRQFEATGEEALSPPVDQRSMAAFLYEEVKWPHATLQFGGRVDQTNYEPGGVLPDRGFTEWSGSLGLLIQPEAANDNFVIAASLARASRAPALEELYYFGPHHGTRSFEIGNPNLEAEHGLGFDLSLRGRSERFEAEVTLFRNNIQNYVFRNPLSEDEFEEREEEFHERFGVEEEPEEDAHGGEFPFVEFVGRDSVLMGMEAHLDFKLSSVLTLESTFDWVTGKLSDSGEPLPRIPPMRLTTGLKYQKNAFQFGGSVTAASEQDRVFADETPTDGYATMRLFGSYSFNKGGVLNTITARLDNATDKLYRNHLNYLKDDVPEIGRSFKVVYTMGF
ncbi:MAG: TonB-dependent receptor, partial [Acidobacteriota bacterium]|nr:TonB-dependent receptor [Acidobacteriota bacterium]